MKQKDFGLFAVVAIISAVISIIISSQLITPKKEKSQEVEVISKITSEFIVPANDDKYFNDKSNNPTKLIKIGDNVNTSPFNKASN